MQNWHEGRVVSVEEIAKDIREVTFAVAGAAGFEPGSHIRIQIGGRNGGAVRSYTVLPSAPGTLRIAVKRHTASRGGSAYIWSLATDDLVIVTLPENRFPLSWRASQYLLIAGGIGITPIYGMARALNERAKSLRVVYGAREREQLAYQDELRAELGDKLACFVSGEGQHIDLEAEIAALPADGEAYICGPLSMLEAMKTAWNKAGRAPSRLRFEVFGDSGNFPEMPFTVELPKLNKTIEVRQDQSLLSALTEAGVDMIYECQRGECGLCAVDVIEADGPIDHRDVFFSEHEKSESHRMCACVSRLPGGRAVIDNGFAGDRV